MISKSSPFIVCRVSYEIRALSISSRVLSKLVLLHSHIKPGPSKKPMNVLSGIAIESNRLYFASTAVLSRTLIAAQH